MQSALTYVDAGMARQIATGLIGSEVRLSEQRNAAVGINFKVVLTNGAAATRSTTTKISDLLPELLANAIYETVTHRIDNLENTRNRFIAGNSDAYVAGTPVLLRNAMLHVDDMDVTAVLSEEACARFRVSIGSFWLRAYAPLGAAEVIRALGESPIETAGVLRFTAPYAAGGALPLTLALRICAIWLR